MKHLRTLSFVLFFSLSAFSDYGWIPKYQNLLLKGGIDFFSSSENFDSTGDLVELQTQSQTSKYRRFYFWIDPEYAFARDWSAGLRVGFLKHDIDSTATGNSGNLMTGSGLGDIRLSTKWRVMRKDPLLTIETLARIPMYGQDPGAPEDLVLGDGLFDLGLILHAGLITRPVYFSFSPGVLLRSGGYSSQFTLSSAMGVILKKAYVRLFSDLNVSLSSPDASTTLNLASGSGGSFAIKSLTPSSFSIGFKSGLNFYEDWKMEFAISKSVWGGRSPNFFLFTVNFVKTIDFYEEEKKIKIQEVPFETDVQEPVPE